MCTPDQLLAPAEADLERATRRRDLAAALAEDWEWWGPLLTGATVPQDEREAVARPPAQGEAAPPIGDATACLQCGGPIPPRVSGGGGRPRKFCSQKCGHAWHAKRTLQRKRAKLRETPATIELQPEPLPDQVERPLHTGDYEDAWLREQLRPPKMPWEAAH